MSFLFNLFFLILVSLPFGNSDDSALVDDMEFTLHVDSKALQPGQNGTLTVDVSMDSSLKAYSDMFEVKAITPEKMLLGSIVVPKEQEFFDKFSKKKRKALVGSGELKIPFELPQQMLSLDRIKIELTYQVCTKKVCFLPKTTKIEKEVQLGGPGLTEVKGGADQPSMGFESALQSGNFILAFLLVFLAGILTSFTPCFYPMIPVTLAVLKNDDNDDMKANILRGLSYVIGIGVTYTLLGLLAVMSGRFFGSMLANQWVSIAVGGFIILMSLSLLGLFETQFPLSWQNKINQFSRQKKYSGPFLFGLLAGVMAGPCVGPVLVSLLAYVAQTQSFVLGGSLLFVYAMGLGFILIVLTSFTSLVSKIPKSGDWMDAFKIFMAYLLFAVGAWYLSSAMDKLYFAILVCIYFCFTGVVIFRSITENSKGFSRIFKRGVSFGAILFGITALVFQLTHQNDLNTQVSSSSKFKYTVFTDNAFKEAIKSQTPIIIDFYADWCVSCHELEALTFTDESVQEEFKRFKFFRVDATRMSDEINELTKRFNVIGLPTILFIDSKGNVLKDKTLTGFEPAEDFLTRIKSVK